MSKKLLQSNVSFNLDIKTSSASLLDCEHTTSSKPARENVTLQGPAVSPLGTWKDICIHLHNNTRVSAWETTDIQEVSIAGVRECMEGSLHSVRYCFWQQGFTLSGESHLYKGMSDAHYKCLCECICVYCCKQSTVKVDCQNMWSTPAYIYKTIWLQLKWKIPLIFSLFHPVSSPHPALPLSVFSLLISVAPSISPNPHRHLCDNNGTPVGVRLVSLWQ